MNQDKNEKMSSTASQTLQSEGSLSVVEARERGRFVRAFDDMAPKLFRFAVLRVNSKPLAEDLVSQTFFKTWKYLKKGNDINHYPAFLYKTLKNLIADHWRGQDSRNVTLDEDLVETLVDENHLPKDQIEKVEFKRVLEATEELNETQRDIIHWYFVDGLSGKKISEITDKSRNAVYVSVYRSTKKLKKTLTKND